MINSVGNKHFVFGFDFITKGNSSVKTFLSTHNADDHPCSAFLTGEDSTHVCQWFEKHRKRNLANMHNEFNNF